MRPDGIIATVAGTGSAGFSGDGGLATQAQVPSPRGVAVGPDGSLYIAGGDRVRKVSPPLSGFTADQIAIPSADGSQLYQFDGVGRHLTTFNTFTGAVLYQFSYDGAGRLAQITDGDNNVTTIVHDGNGNPTAIVGPYSQQTLLQVDGNGYLARVANPAGETHQFTYTAGGLMTSMQTPRQHTYQFSYDALGRLTRDADPTGGMQTLTRTELGVQGFTGNNTGTSYEVTRTTALDRTSRYRVAYPSAGDLVHDQAREVLTNTFPDGTISTVIARTTGVTDTTAPDGTTTTLTEGPDPRFGMQAAIPST